MTVISPTIEQHYIPLSQLEESETAVVHMADLEADERRSLTALGLHSEVTFQLCQQGQPCIIQVEATRLGLSKELTSRIMVRRCTVCH
jgi:Fe2+ transport system protein FeoA|tara:strand:- start:305 stop:568 length:264 start_codon:yes stop_codon:yes gene_type:complete